MSKFYLNKTFSCHLGNRGIQSSTEQFAEQATAQLNTNSFSKIASNNFDNI